MILLRPPNLLRCGPFFERKNVCNSRENGVRTRCAAIVNHPAVLKILRVVNSLRVVNLVRRGPLGLCLQEIRPGLLPPPQKKITYAEKILRNYFRGDWETISRNRLRKRLGSDFGRTDFSRIFIFGPPDIFADFLAGFFLLFFVGKVPRKILQENPRGNPPKFIQQKSSDTLLQIGWGKKELSENDFLGNYVNFA